LHDSGAAVNSIDLSFSDMTLVLKSKKKGDVSEMIILNGSVKGRAQPGRLLAILGPSGAGKSSLLHALAGRIKHNKKLTLRGRRYVNGVPLAADSFLPAALIEQDVTFFSHMTVAETIQFRVQLKLGSTLDLMKREAVVNNLLQRLDLVRVADTIVGDSAKVRGISGGERKRLSIAVEMITAPAIILLDEPTSGLDSTSALQLVRTLRHLADGIITGSSHHPKGTSSECQDKKTTVIAVLHQPNQHVLDVFDDLLLLGQGGQQMYFGPRIDVRKYMENDAKCPAPPEMGTAEHCLDCISSFPMNEDEIVDPTLVINRIERLIRLSDQSKHPDLGIMATSERNGKEKRYTSSNSGPRANVLLQFQLLFQRSIHEIVRSKLTLILYLVRLISMALIYGSIYQLKLNQSSIQDRYGLLSLIIIGAANMGMSKTIRSFPREKSIVSNEISAGMYHTMPYFIGKAISEIPLSTVFNSIFGIFVYLMTGLDRDTSKLLNFIVILTIHGIVSEAVGLFIGSISPNSDVALAIYPAVVVLNIIFDVSRIRRSTFFLMSTRCFDVHCKTTNCCFDLFCQF
jgi:ABC-type lipoprotein export system ATPase subunit